MRHTQKVGVVRTGQTFVGGNYDYADCGHGTLFQQRVRELAEKGAGLYLWSRHGAEHARRVAAELGLEGCFLSFLPKPLDIKTLAERVKQELHAA